MRLLCTGCDVKQMNCNANLQLEVLATASVFCENEKCFHLSVFLTCICARLCAPLAGGLAFPILTLNTYFFHLPARHALTMFHCTCRRGGRNCGVDDTCSDTTRCTTAAAVGTYSERERQ